MPKPPPEKPKPKHAKPPRGQTRAEKAAAKAKETGDKAKFRWAANRAADAFQAAEDATKRRRRNR